MPTKDAKASSSAPSADAKKRKHLAGNHAHHPALALQVQTSALTDMLGLHLWLKQSANEGCNASPNGFQPKENVGDTILFSAITVVLVLVAGLMSGTALE